MWRETLDEYCLPQVVNHQEVTFEGLTHPLIPNAVPNTLNVDNHILLTGSNASGKSTFMKAIALNLITAQTIQTAKQLNLNINQVMSIHQWLTKMIFFLVTVTL